MPRSTFLVALAVFSALSLSTPVFAQSADEPGVPPQQQQARSQPEQQASSIDAKSEPASSEAPLSESTAQEQASSVAASLPASVAASSVPSSLPASILAASQRSSVERLSSAWTSSQSFLRSAITSVPAVEASRSDAISVSIPSSASSIHSASASASADIYMPQSGSGLLAAIMGEGAFERETFGYDIPVISPAAIAHPYEFSLSPHAIGGNLLLAFLVALVLGFSSMALRRIVASDEPRVKQLLDRLPFQALLTVLLLWLIDFFIPGANAQGPVSVASVSLMQIPLYAIVFFLVVGSSNYLFNNMLNADGGVLAGHSFFSRFFEERQLHSRMWFILLLILGYGIVGAHINPEFSLLPGRQVGILLVVTITIILSVCLKDLFLYGLARSWRVPGWFTANVGGFCIAIVCVALSRALNLNPGYIYGVPIGLLLASHLSREREGLFEFLGIVWILLLAVIAWVLGSFSGGYPVLFDLFNLLFVILAEDAFFEMLPLPYLAGGTIFGWKKLPWFVLFTAVLFFLFHTLFNPQGTVMGLAESPPTAATFLILGCYAVGVFLLWAYVTWGRTKRA